MKQNKNRREREKKNKHSPLNRNKNRSTKNKKYLGKMSFRSIEPMRKLYECVCRCMQQFLVVYLLLLHCCICHWNWLFAANKRAYPTHSLTWYIFINSWNARYLFVASNNNNNSAKKNVQFYFLCMHMFLSRLIRNCRIEQHVEFPSHLTDFRKAYRSKWE